MAGPGRAAGRWWGAPVPTERYLGVNRWSGARSLPVIGLGGRNGSDKGAMMSQAHAVQVAAEFRVRSRQPVCLKFAEDRLRIGS